MNTTQHPLFTMMSETRCQTTREIRRVKRYPLPPRENPAHPRLSRILMALVLPVIFAIVLPLWILIGWISLRRLGLLLERTGRNLQSYWW